MKKLWTLLYPVSLLYGGVVSARHWLYDKKILKSAVFNFPLICVGNLATGGTGKTPMTEYLVEMLKDKYKVATLSRGYKRKTTGFAIANEQTTALDIGDEPMQFHLKYPRITVSVGEERLVAIPQLLHDRPWTEVIILDDAFQHRQVSAGLNILLTDYRNLYANDLLLPAGDLRDVRSAAHRAQAIVVTKCKPSLNENERNEIVAKLKPRDGQQVFFTESMYGIPVHLFSAKTNNLQANQDILLVTGIAQPAHLQEFLKNHFGQVETLRFADHHIFTSDDLRRILKKFDTMSGLDKIILTTEKDAVRLVKFQKELEILPIYTIPVRHAFLFNEAARFEKLVIDFIESFSKSPSATTTASG